MLNGKCKIEFRKWYKARESKLLEIIGDEELDRRWYTLDLDYKWGVYLEFFDSVGVDIEASIYWDWDKEKHVGFKCSAINIKNFGEDEEFTLVKTRKEAQQEAIKQANELFNELNGK